MKVLVFPLPKPHLLTAGALFLVTIKPLLKLGEMLLLPSILIILKLAL
jgi:hypothetical protein